MIEFDELKRLAEAATPGQWSAAISSNMNNSVHVSMGKICDTGKNIDDAAFIAAANPAAILALLARLEAAEAELERLRSQEPVAYMDSRYGLCWYKDRKPSPETMLYTEPKPPTHPGATHCENCGCTWLDDGLNPVGCPYCKKKQELTV